MLFEPVWVSSVEHLRTFERIHRETSFLRRLVSGYRLPVGFPYVRLGLGHCVPLVMFANGQLQIQDHQLDFESRPFSSDRPQIGFCLEPSSESRLDHGNGFAGQSIL